MDALVSHGLSTSLTVDLMVATVGLERMLTLSVRRHFVSMGGAYRRYSLALQVRMDKVGRGSVNLGG